MTPSFLIQRTAYRFKAVPFWDLIWVHKKVTKHYHNGIPTGKTYSVLLKDRYGRAVEAAFNRKEKRANDMLAGLSQRAPWVLIGYSKELEAAWKSRPAEVVQAVDSRRQQVMGAATQAPPASPAGA